MKFDLEALEKTLGDSATALLKSVTKEGQKNLKEFGKDIAKDMVRAVKDDRPKLKDELRAQITALGELNRIRLNGVSWDWVSNALGIVTDAARGALLAAGEKFANKE